ncbi:MAG: hypothetical protein AAFP84_12755 [Actinomycetota bacterium]
MARHEQYPGPTEALDRYLAAIAELPDVERKGAKNPYTSRNGHMFSFLAADGTLAIRFSAERQQEFLATNDSSVVEAYGRTMRGYVRVPDDLVADAASTARLLAESHEWIGTLQPKSTTSRRTTGSART